MPGISPALRKLISDGKLSAAEVSDVVKAVKGGQASAADLKLLADRFGDLFEAGTGTPLVALAREVGSAVKIAPPVRSLGDDVDAAAVLRGDRTLSASTNSRDPAVLSFQRALNALASRTGHPDWGLLGSGADGAFGAESSRAVAAFQKAHQLPESGAIDRATAVEIERELYTHAPPDVGGVTAGPRKPDGDAIARAALELVRTRAADYGVAPAWKSPNPDVPGNKKPGVTELGATNRWKCNLFGLDALWAGGGKPPAYASGWYPIATEIPGFSKGRNPPFIKLGEVWPDKTTPEDTARRVADMMAMARPGDFIMVRHHGGGGGADGGHTRVVTANHFAQDGGVDCAQAGTNAAHVRAETLGSFTGEEAVYLIRPNQPR